MKRKIVKIDESKCNGCGLCIPNCPEGALKIINGKARMVSEFSCDGLGACLGHCPEGAISIEEREAESYDEAKAMEEIVKKGESAVQSHLNHLHEHGETEYLRQARDFLKKKGGSIMQNKISEHVHMGCPGSRTIDRTKQNSASYNSVPESVQSELRQWPIQLALINPNAPYFQNADLLVSADCVPFSYANFHSRFLKNKTLVLFCPKLDQDLSVYIEKLAVILKENEIKSLSVARMEVPCCSGTTAILEEALKKSGKNIPIREYVISLQGEII